MTRQPIVAFVAGVLLGPAIVWAGLETGTYISDLVATNPLTSDLASTADDHIRLLKSTIKATFPNINNAVTVTDEQLNAVGGSGVTGAANPTGNVGLAAVNGAATTFMRSDGAPALSQTITPTWTGTHTFTKVATNSDTGAILLSSTFPRIGFFQSNAAANNGRWTLTATGEQFSGTVEDDAHSAATAWLTVDRTGTVVDSVAFPTDALGGVGGVFRLGTNNSSAGLANVLMQVRSTAAQTTAVFRHTTSATNPLGIHNEGTSGDNQFIVFGTEAAFSNRGGISYNRAGGLIAYNTTSDARLKKNFKPAPSARRVIDCVQVESFDWKETGNHVDHGFVAQRLNKCAPYAVSSSADPKFTWGVDPSKLVPALIKYVQEQDARIARLEADANRRH